jgi:hypothetical protein
MQLALDYGIEPKNMAVGALAAIALLIEQAEQHSVPGDMHFGDWRRLNAAQLRMLLKWLWKGQTSKYVPQFTKCLRNAVGPLDALVAK